MIKQGRVVVDGEPAHLGQKIDRSTARVLVDGVPLPVDPARIYILYNKPTGVVSTASDPEGRPTVVDAVDVGARIYPVGRLDADSEGLLILTNDGALTEHLTHPRHGVAKTYTVLVDGKPDGKALARLATGVELDDGPAAATRATLIDAHDRKALVELTMVEGRKREVRRMLDAIGHPVLRLVRTAIGPLRDRDLKPGEWRHLTVQEIRSLYSAGDDGS